MNIKNSEIQQLMQQIESEYSASQQVLKGFAITSRHAFITARMQSLWELRERLAECVGPGEANKMICEQCLNINAESQQ